MSKDSESNAVEAKIIEIDYKKGNASPYLSQRHSRGSRPKDKMVVAGSNGTFVLINDNELSKINAVVELPGGIREIIPIKHAIKQATGWEKITSKRAEKIINNPPQTVSVYKDDEGQHRISDEDMEKWGENLTK